MKTSNKRLGFRQSLIALAVVSAFGPAFAQDVPASSVSLGFGAVSGDQQDRGRFGLFNGMREDRGYGLLDFSYLNRDAASGLWTTIEGRNLGLDTREVGFTTRRLGSWKFSADYGEIVRNEPRTINTGMQGVGSTTPTIVRLDSIGSGQDVHLKLERKAIGFAGSAWLGGNFQFEANFKSEDKTGSRIFGKGFACSASWVAAGSCTSSTTQWALLMLPEPVDSTIRQGEAKLTYTAGGLLLTAGYAGSIYTNDNGNISPSIPASLSNPLGASQTLDAGLRTTLGLPLALQPDNEAHQFFLSGNYRFTPTTAATFKYARTKAKQNESFAGNGFALAPSGRSDLGGEVDTTIAQVGFSSRPIPKLSLTANARYEKKEDKTPIDLYNIEGGDSTRFTNSTANPTKRNIKLEASYLLPENFRGVVGVDWDDVNHGEFTPTSSVAGLSGLREKTKETGYRFELRRNIAEDLTGSIAYVHSKREGDAPWLKPLSLTQGRGVIEANADPGCVPPAAPAINNCIYNRTGIFPYIFEDRERNKAKVMASWVPTDQLSLQFYAESGKDKYKGPTEHGLRDTALSLYSIDAAYRMSDDWSLTAYGSRGKSTIHAGHSTGYDAELEDVSTALGLALKGKASERLGVSVDLTYLNDKLKYLQETDPSASAANIAFLASAGGLPDVTYRVMRIRLAGDYAIDKRSSLRVAIVHDRSKFDEWTWQWNNNFFYYSDNTTVSAKENQNVTFGGVTYTYRW